MYSLFQLSTCCQLASAGKQLLMIVKLIYFKFQLKHQYDKNLIYFLKESTGLVVVVMPDWAPHWYRHL
jgi:hypothetical protein